MNIESLLTYELSRESYPHSGSFAGYLLETGWYDVLSPGAVKRLNEYVGETEHEGYDIPKEEWDHLIHYEAKRDGINIECLSCLVKGTEMVVDYVDYCCFGLK
jgi:hypothetical protein